MIKISRLKRPDEIKIYISVSLGAFIFLSGDSLRSEEFKAISKVRAVTVYASEAQVERVAALSLAAGEHRVVIEKLPPQLDENQITITGRGEAKVKIRGVLVETQHLEESFQDKVKDLEEKIESVRREIESVSDQVNAAAAEVEFLNSLKTAASAPNTTGDRSQDPREVMIKKILPADYSTFMSFYRKTVLEKQSEKRKLSDEMKKLQERKSKLHRELAELGRQSKMEKRASVDLTCSQPGAFNLMLNYMIAPAYWKPFYDVRVRPDSGDVALTYHAVVTQNTGEDWEDVELALSTLKPALGATPPPAGAWYVGYEEAPPVIGGDKALRKKAARMIEGKNLTLAYETSAGALAPAVADLKRQTAELDLDAERETAERSESGSAVRFEIKSKETIASGKSSRKLSPAVLELKADFEYETVPRLSPHAYLKSKVTNSDDFPLLDGKMDVYLQNNFVGSGGLKAVAPGQEFDLYAGADDGIKVSVENIKAGRKESTGMQDKTVTFSYRMKIENFKRVASSVTLVDRIPLATDKRVKVSSPDFDPKPTEEDTDQGIYKWKLELEPKQNSEVTVHYKVTYPKKGRIVGL